MLEEDVEEDQSAPFDVEAFHASYRPVCLPLYQDHPTFQKSLVFLV